MSNLDKVVSNMDRAELGLKVAKRRARDFLLIVLTSAVGFALMAFQQHTRAVPVLLCAVVQALVSIEGTLYEIFKKLNAPDSREG